LCDKQSKSQQHCLSPQKPNPRQSRKNTRYFDELGARDKGRFYESPCASFSHIDGNRFPVAAACIHYRIRGILSIGQARGKTISIVSALKL